jgi:hypothetical protein
MKLRTLSYALIGSLILAVILWVYFTIQTVQTDVVFEAIVNRDCAPWDGMAYTIIIPDRAGSKIVVSIWKSPDFHFPGTYSFLDSSGRVGTAVLQSPVDSFQPLNGKITMHPFKAGNPIEGWFNFTTEDGGVFIGNFKAEWGNQTAFCG